MITVNYGYPVNCNTCSIVHFRSQVNLAFVNRLKNFREQLVIKFQLDLFAFDRERVHNEVEINFPLSKNYSVANDFISIYHVLCFQEESSFTFRLACSCACLLRWNFEGR